MRKHRILIVDDTHTNIRVLNDLLQNNYDVSAATNGSDALKMAGGKIRPDLILLDIMMPEMNGYDVCRELKKNEYTKKIPVLFITAMTNIEDEIKGLKVGAVDYITKPFSPAMIKERVKNHISLHRYQEHLEQLVDEKTNQLQKGYIDTIHRLILASEFKDEETGAHVKRISYYTKELALIMGMGKEFADTIFYASPMHDIGKISIPDSILLKEGPLNNEEWAIMKTHAAIGAQILKGSDSPFLEMAVDIAGCHHERWDGSGYPNRLKKDQTPLTARIMNITDQYDALRSKRPYKPGFDHDKTVSIITRGDGRTLPEHFDPDVLNGFKNVLSLFCEIYETHKEE
ncbi:MAG: response regulator [Desulfobacula sp.]|jgi:putative two-component system response regulator|nr:response regulator [Desulfobacula sp.]